MDMRYEVNTKLHGNDIFLLMDGNTILEGGVLPVGGELYAFGITPFYRHAECLRYEHHAEDAECIRKRINEACIPLYGFTAYLASKVDFYSAEFDEATFVMDEQSMFEEYTAMLPVGIPTKLRNSQSEGVKMKWQTFYQQTLKDEQKSQKNISYKDFFGGSLEKYRMGYLDWLRDRIREKPVITFESLIHAEHRKEHLGKLDELMESIKDAESNGRIGGKGDADFGRYIYNLAESGDMDIKKKPDGYYDTRWLKPILKVRFPYYKDKAHWQSIQQYITGKRK